MTKSIKNKIKAILLMAPFGLFILCSSGWMFWTMVGDVFGVSGFEELIVIGKIFLYIIICAIFAWVFVRMIYRAFELWEEKTMSKQWDSWDTIESLRKSRDGWYDETQLQLARAEAAEARVKELKLLIRDLSERLDDLQGEHLPQTCGVLGKPLCRVHAALAAKEKP